MRRGGVLLCLIFFSPILAVRAQSTQPPTTGATPVAQPSPIFPRGTGRASQTVSLAVPSNDTPSPAAMPEGLALQQMIVHTYAQEIYRKPTEKEMMGIAPQSGIGNRYHDFLATENTGIFRLVPDHHCDENTKVISATDDCLKYTMPGSGSSYSFRAETYRIRDLADLTYSGDMLRISGMMMQGMLVSLGDTAVEQVSLTSNGLGYLVSFQPVTDFEKAKAIDDEIVAGLTRDGFLYKRSLPVTENTTYALRAVAYRGKLFRSVRGIPYNEFDFDKRRDVIVVFRVAYKDANGELTIVWKELSNAESPKLKPPANTNMKDQRSQTADHKPE